MNEDEIRKLIYSELSSVAPESDPASLAPMENVREALDIDSFDFLQFLIAISEKIGVEVPEKDYAKLASIEGMVRYLSAHVHS